jgi:glucokinase
MGEKLALGIDLGGTQLRVALVDACGSIVRRAAAATDLAGPAAVIGQIRRLYGEVRAGEDSSGVTAVGVSAPGPLDSETGTIIAIPTLPGWDDFPLTAALAEEFGLPVVVENDGIAAANGEWRFGAARGLSHFVYVTVSTGIGGGIAVDGRLLHGRRGLAGHVGHMIVRPGGPVCSCGAHGCFEALASGSALTRAAREAAAAQPEGLLAKLPADAITGRDVVNAARQGDALALSLLEREAEWLGLGFASLAHLYSPEMIVMGGGVSQAFDLLQDGIAASFRASAMPPFRSVRIVPARLGDNAGLAGAAALAWERERR